MSTNCPLSSLSSLWLNICSVNMFFILQPTGDSNTVDLFLTTSAALVTHVDVTTLNLLDRNRMREMVDVYPLPAVQTMSSQRPSTV